MLHRVLCLSLVCAIFCSASCSGQRSGPKIKKVPVVPVQGTIKVDGNPEAGVIVRCVPLGSFEPNELKNALGGRTDEDGNFTLGTYEIADGVPPSEYALLFVWPPQTLKRQSRAEEEKSDRLKGKYSTVANALVKIKVEDGNPLVLDDIELKTK